MLGGIRIRKKKLAGPFNGKFHGTFVIDTGLCWNIIVVVPVGSKAIIFFLAKLSFFEIVLFFVASIFSRGFLLVFFAFFLLLALLLFLILFLLFALVTVFLDLLSDIFLVFAFVRLRLFVLSQNIFGKFVVHVNHSPMTTSSTIVVDASITDFVLGFGQSTIGADDESFDVKMYQLLKHIVAVGAVNNGSVGLLVVGGLGTEFATKELGDFSRGTMQTQSDIRDVWNCSFDSVTGAFDLSKDGRHFVAVLRIINRVFPGNVDDGSSTKGHDGQ
mmetsp:Transcript_9745/g.21036  ORF Transcript_9745/g.21036 Transcript_9745/m.21036 type:complete len:273 (-) Transcript_9745:386-1204(-)